MIQVEHGLFSGCKCPDCGAECHDCMGSEQPPMSVEELKIRGMMLEVIRSREEDESGF